METIGSKRSYALIWCMPNNDDDVMVIHRQFVAKCIIYQWTPYQVI